MSAPGPLQLRASDLEPLPFEERLEACRSFIERATALLDGAGRRSVEASDPAGLVTAQVSGAGTVDEVRLEPGATVAGRAELEAAVQAAVDAARARLTAEVTGALERVRVDSDGWAAALPTPTGHAEQVTERLHQARQRLAGEVFASSAPGDEARVVVDVDGGLRGVRLAPLAVRQTDRHALGELILGCIRRAQQEAGEALAAALRDLDSPAQP